MKIVATDPVTAPPESDPEAVINAQREAALDAVHQWYHPDGKPYDLEPFSDGRDFLLWDLVNIDGGIDWKLVKLNNTLLLPTAAKLLYLCSHKPAAWRPYRSDRMAFIEAIEAWASRYIPVSLHWQAMALAIRLINDSTINQAVPRPTDSAVNAGN